MKVYKGISNTNPNTNSKPLTKMSMSVVANAEFKFMNYKYVVSTNLDVTRGDCLSIDGIDGDGDGECVLPHLFIEETCVKLFRKILSLAFSNKREQMMSKIAKLKKYFYKEGIDIQKVILLVDQMIREGAPGGALWQGVIWNNNNRVQLLEVLFQHNLANRFLKDLVKYVKIQDEIRKATQEIRKATEATLLEKTTLPEDVIRQDILSYL